MSYYVKISVVDKLTLPDWYCSTSVSLRKITISEYLDLLDKNFLLIVTLQLTQLQISINRCRHYQTIDQSLLETFMKRSLTARGAARRVRGSKFVKEHMHTDML